MPHVIESTAEMPHFIQSCPWKGQKVPLILLRAGKVSKYSMHPCRQIMFSSSCRYQMVSYSCFTSPEPEMTQNSCPIRQRSSKSYEILLSKPFYKAPSLRRQPFFLASPAWDISQGETSVPQ